MKRPELDGKEEKRWMVGDMIRQSDEVEERVEFYEWEGRDKRAAGNYEWGETESMSGQKGSTGYKEYCTR